MLSFEQALIVSMPLELYLGIMFITALLITKASILLTTGPYMEFVKVFFIYFILSKYVYADLKPFITKQPAGKIRYLSKNGRVSFYQNKKGVLSLYKNFKIDTILSAPPETQYFVLPGVKSKIFILLKNQFFLTSNSIRNLSDIYQFDLRKKSKKYLGKGLSPKIHLLDTWVSYYNPHQKKIHVKSLVNSLMNFELLINTENNPFFIPDALLIDNNRLLFTDVNKQGNIGLFLFNRSKNEIETIYKDEFIGRKIELCALNNHLYVGQFPLNGISGGGQIIEIDLDKKISYSKGRIVYESKMPDYGNILCSSFYRKIYFIKSFSNGKGNYNIHTDIIELNPLNKKSSRISNKNYITQIIEMDTRILTLYKGKFFIVKGGGFEPDKLD